MTAQLQQQRTLIQPRLVELIAGLRLHQVEEAVQILLDYIDASAARSQAAQDTGVDIDALILEAWNKRGGGTSWSDFYQGSLVGIQIGASYTEAGK